MVQNLSDLKRDLTSLVWDQFYHNSISFNLISFSAELRQWRPEVTLPTRENCHDAVAWIETLRAEGSTPTLKAIKMALRKEEEEGEEENEEGKKKVDGIYLLSDGKPDTSMAKVMKNELLPFHESEFVAQTCICNLG